MPAVGNAAFQNQFHEFFCRGAHVLEALAERHDCEAHSLEVLYHLNRAPSVEGNLTNVISFAELFDETLYVTVMDHVSLCGLQKTLPLPEVVGDMISSNSQFHILFRYPEVGENDVFIVIVSRREH